MPLEHMRRMFREMETGKNRLSKKEWFELSNLMHGSSDALSLPSGTVKAAERVFKMAKEKPALFNNVDMKAAESAFHKLVAAHAKTEGR